jgi:hypothetical protein
MPARSLPAVLAIALICSAAVAATSSPNNPRTIAYVSVSDHDGHSVDDLTVKDFLVKVDAKQTPVLSAEKASDPIALAFVVSTQWGFAGKRFESGASNDELLRFRRAATEIVTRLREMNAACVSALSEQTPARCSCTPRRITWIWTLNSLTQPTRTS